MRPIVWAASLALVLSVLGGRAFSQTNTPTAGHITSMTGGWTSPYLLVALDIPVFNPNNCTWTDGYVVDASLPANQLLSSMLITAFAQGRVVQLTLQGCSTGREAIIGVTVLPHS
jgi:hypothetical protein